MEDVVHLQADTTEDGGVRISVTYGPVLCSVIFDADDEDAVIEVMRKAFTDARVLKGEVVDVHTH